MKTKLIKLLLGVLCLLVISLLINIEIRYIINDIYNSPDYSFIVAYVHATVLVITVMVFGAFINYNYKLIRSLQLPKVTKEPINTIDYIRITRDEIYKIKCTIKWFFDGDENEYYDQMIKPKIKNCPLYRLGIHNIVCTKQIKTKHGIFNSNIEVGDQFIHITITLDRPGLLIGKAGNTYDMLVKELEDKLSSKVHIDIIESKLWNY